MTNTKSPKWVYRGEGNANLVLSLPGSRQILRIKKSINPKTLYERTLDFLKYWLNWEDVYSITCNSPTEQKECVCSLAQNSKSSNNKFNMSKNLKSPMNRLNPSLNVLNPSMDNLNSPMSSLNSSIDDLNSSMDNLNSSTENLHSSMDNLNSSLQNLNSSRQTLTCSAHNIKKFNVLDQIVSWMVNVLKSKYKNVIYSEVRDLKFYKAVMRPLLGTNYTCDCTSVYLTKRETKEIEHCIESIRPEYRRNKRLCYGRATIFDDYALLPKWMEDEFCLTGPTYSIEIKPKQGWYPVSERNEAKCQFCLKQYLKLERGQIDNFTSYCPLDLFSGDKSRMLKSIKALIENPQNNFKVFLDGHTLYGEHLDKDMFQGHLSELFNQCSSELESMQEFCEFIHEVLTRRIASSNYNKGCETSCEHCVHKCKPIQTTPWNVKVNYDYESFANINSDHKAQNIKLNLFKGTNSLEETSLLDNLLQETDFKTETQIGNALGSCHYTESNLPKGCVLQNIYSMQKLNDKGLAYYGEIYRNREIDEAMYSTYIDELLEKLSRKDIAVCPGCLVTNGVVLKCKSNLSESVCRDQMDLLKYLLFSVARDCSLMITFRKVAGEIRELKDCIIQTKSGETFAVKVGIIDLSPKPLSTISKAIKRNAKIAKAYRRSLSNSSK